jgi:hypothetical protein
MKHPVLLSLVLSMMLMPLAAEVQGEFAYTLPYDSVIAHVVEPQEGSVELLTSQALHTPYGLQWLELYVPGELHRSFVHTYDQLLSSLLPCEQVLIGKATLRGNLQEVPFRILSERPATGSCVWYRDENGQDFLLSLSLEYL